MTIDLHMPETAYHAHPALSSTQARQLLKSPAHYRHNLTEPARTSGAFDVGSAVHAKVLGVGSSIAVLDFPDYRTKAAQMERDGARAMGQVPMLSHEMKPVDDMAEAVLAHPTARALFEQAGNPEASVFGTCDETGIDVRARFDYLTDTGASIDLKTSMDASPHGFAGSAAKYGYHVQRGHYLHTLDMAVGRDTDLVFVVVEKAAPYLVGVYRLDEDFADMGVDQAQAARRILRECRAADQWPGYPSGITDITAPMWAIYEHQDRFGGNDEIRI